MKLTKNLLQEYDRALRAAREAEAPRAAAAALAKLRGQPDDLSGAAESEGNAATGSEPVTPTTTALKSVQYTNSPIVSSPYLGKQAKPAEEHAADEEHAPMLRLENDSDESDEDDQPTN
ncbi:MAG: hypothetical protein ABMA15_12015 [Vicinamibacterales bacterium]